MFVWASRGGELQGLVFRGGLSLHPPPFSSSKVLDTQESEPWKLSIAIEALSIVQSWFQRNLSKLGMKNTGQVFLSLTALQAPAQSGTLSPDSQQDMTLLPVHGKRGRSPLGTASEPTVNVGPDEL